MMQIMVKAGWKKCSYHESGWNKIKNPIKLPIHFYLLHTS